MPGTLSYCAETPKCFFSMANSRDDPLYLHFMSRVITKLTQSVRGHFAMLIIKSACLIICNPGHCGFFSILCE